MTTDPIRHRFSTGLLPDMPLLPIRCDYPGDCAYHPHSDREMETGYCTSLTCFAPEYNEYSWAYCQDTNRYTPPKPDRTFRIVAWQRDSQIAVILSDDDDHDHCFYRDDPPVGYYESICRWLDGLIVANPEILEDRLIPCGWIRY